jgi:uncharacterized beta-barrel protein YwiB (DUF1934 family)
MKKDVLISIKGTVIPEGAAPDIIELITAGRYYNKEGSYFISYKESETTGFEGVTTTLKVEGDSCVTLTRSGASNSSLVLEKGRRHLCHYDTGFGDLMVGVSGCRINSRLDDGGGELTFNYSLDINSSLVSQNEVYISVKEAPKTVC